MKTMQKMLLAAGLALLSPSVAHAGSFVINGVTYNTTASSENVTALFTTPDGGVTTNSYSNYVEVTVSGTGMSEGSMINDAFYLVDGSNNPVANGNMPPGTDPDFYQLTVNNTTLQAFNPSQDAKNFIAYDVTTGMQVAAPYVPAYNPNHTYDFIINTSLLSNPSGGQLHFGVSDGDFSDNGGAYNINVTQLNAIPEASTVLGFGGLIGAGGIGLLRKRRKG